MEKLNLSFACGPYDRMDPLAKKEVEPQGINLNYITIQNPREIFDRMINDQEFDASEMSVSEYVCRCIVVNTGIIKTPSDLNGKKIGVQIYTMTAAVWIRGVLQEAGVGVSSITWVEGDLRKPGSHGKPRAKPLLRPVNRVRNESSSSLSQLLETGKIAATIGADVPTCFGKARHIQHLFPNVRQTEKEYFQRTGIFPIMHLVVIKKDVLDRHPFVAMSLFKAMNESKDIALAQMKFASTYRYMLPFLPSDLKEIEDLFGGDPWPYGVEPNRKVLESLVTFLYDQAMIAQKVPLEELFPIAVQAVGSVTI
ncbi:hypothetical protein ZTR_03747 [Talaromyces verruculosus]|nr:hypothetical protein ZTR_03747 [Talaromyces verruculosus]